jgi:hypothetical protein
VQLLDADALAQLLIVHLGNPVDVPKARSVVARGRGDRLAVRAEDGAHDRAGVAEQRRAGFAQLDKPRRTSNLGERSFTSEKAAAVKHCDEAEDRRELFVNPDRSRSIFFPPPCVRDPLE